MRIEIANYKVRIECDTDEFMKRLIPLVDSHLSVHPEETIEDAVKWMMKVIPVGLFIKVGE